MELRLILHTVLHLRIRQIVGQIWYRVFKPVYQSLSFAGEIARMDVVAFIRKPFSWDGKNFSFLNLVSPFFSWNDTSQGMLWAYNLNYMDWLLQKGTTYEEGEKWIDKFCREISGNKVGLDPYPIALRGINWIKFIVQYADRIPIQKREVWTNLLYSQYCLLARKLEYHLLGNHLLEDAYSLYIASLYFQSKKLYRKASKLLKQELKEQVLPDGAHYEQSPMYHCILLDRLLDCYNFSVHNVRFGQQREMNNFLEDKVKQMLGWLKAIIYEDGSLPLLNDSANGIAPTSREIFDYARRLGLIIEESRLKESGYRKIRLTWGEVILDVGGITASYQPGHSHADTFNYELRINGQPFIVDTGISTYNKTERRQWERGTAAHNTVVVGCLNSSEVWGGFRVGRRANVYIVEEQEGRIVAEHDGYGKRCRHQRSFIWDDLQCLKIIDKLSSDETAMSYIHLAPEVVILSQESKIIETNQGILKIENADSIDLLDDFVSQEYNVLRPCKVIAIHFTKTITYTILPK